MTLKEIEILAAKRHDQRWLKKRMVKKGGDEVCRALAGSLLCREEDLSTVSVFKHPLWDLELPPEGQRQTEPPCWNSELQPS